MKTVRLYDPSDQLMAHLMFNNIKVTAKPCLTAWESFYWKVECEVPDEWTEGFDHLQTEDPTEDIVFIIPTTCVSDPTITVKVYFDQGGEGHTSFTEEWDYLERKYGKAS